MFWFFGVLKLVFLEYKTNWRDKKETFFDFFKSRKQVCCNPNWPPEVIHGSRKRKSTHAWVVVVISTNFALQAGDVWSLTRQSKTCKALFLEDVLFWSHCRNTWKQDGWQTESCPEGRRRDCKYQPPDVVCVFANGSSILWLSRSLKTNLLQKLL